MEICEKNHCTGCGACINACPVNAIELKKDKLSTKTAAVNDQKCIGCMKCKRVCPSVSGAEFYTPVSCYAAETKSVDDKQNSASGGIAAALGRYFIDSCGLVFGVRFDTDNILKFDSAQTTDEMLSFRGSKYVLAETGNVFKDIKTAAEEGKPIMFVGTPCQVAGLKNYLNKDYENLLLVDLVCHGVSNVDYLNEYVGKKIKKKNYTTVEFRGKNGIQLAVYDNEKLIYHKYKEYDLFYMAYAKSLILRENCYECGFVGTDRVGDITIGDFWGLDKKTLKQTMGNKISLVLVNNKKGQKFFDAIKSSLILEERNLNEAIPHNKHFTQPPIPHTDREFFKKEYLHKGNMVKALKKTSLQKDICKKRFSSISYQIKHLLGL